MMLAVLLHVACAASQTRQLALLSKQPAFCASQFGTNYVWLAQADLPCLGIHANGCSGKDCGELVVNNQTLKVTNINNDDHDVCGTCEGCPVAFVGFTTSLDASAHAVEGQVASVTYHPPTTSVTADPLPDCPTLPQPWKVLPNKVISPGCSPSESRGSLGIAATADECFAKVKAASSKYNYAVWRGDTTKSCDVCAFQWRGPAEGWKYADLVGASSFSMYIALPPPQPSGPCAKCPSMSMSTTRFEPPLSISNNFIKATFGPRGITSISSADLEVTVGNDAFAVGLDRANDCTCSASLAAPTVSQRGNNAVSFVFASPSQQLQINVTYEIRAESQKFLSKTIQLTDTSGQNKTREVNSVTAMAGAIWKSNGKASNDVRVSSAVEFQRFPATTAPAAHSTGLFLTAQNQFVLPPELSFGMDQNWTTLDEAGRAAPRVLDSAIIGLYSGLTSQLEYAEAAAVAEAVKHYLVAPSADNETVKINIAWCENDYQLDIANQHDRDTYKRIIDRAAQMGLTHILFAPQNSDVSSQQNNTDPWGWEQLLWFGYGQKLRMGQWKPGDPLAASLSEMLDYFKLKGVKPVAYVYPILAFLEGTLPNGGSPPWIVQGTYDASQTPLLGGVTRSNLANEEFIKWLPDTMIQFAEQTGAGGFSFDLTYWEEKLPIASEYAQWSAWRQILSQLHTARGGKACSGSRCVVDNRQANHAWGAWMWALGGSYAEPLMSDEQPASWSFYEADLHTDRLAGNKQRSVAKLYRDEYCPNEALPGFAFHQTDRDPTALQTKVCPGPEGRCSNHSRVRDFDLLGYRYSLLSSVGTGGLNNVVNMLPARDVDEFSKFPERDLAFLHDWMVWADENVALLKLTRPLPSLATPGPGLVDGTIMLHANNNTGVIFLFNPTMRELNVSLPLSGNGNASLGFTCSPGGTTAPILVEHLASSERTTTSFNVEVLGCSDMFTITVPPTTAQVFAFSEWDSTAVTNPLLLGGPSSKVEINSGSTLSIIGGEGESGTSTTLRVVLPPGMSKIANVTLNALPISKFATEQFRGGLSAVVLHVTWAGQRFRRAQEVTQQGSYTGPLSNIGKRADTLTQWKGSFSVTQGVIDQLKERNASYPIEYSLNPLDSDDANVPWLAPGRLLIFVKYQTPIDDTLNVTGTIDGHPLLVRKAYNTIVRNPGRFIGHWADVTPLVQVGQQQWLTLQLPAGPVLQGIFFDNVETVCTPSFNTD